MRIALPLVIGAVASAALTFAACSSSTETTTPVPDASDSGKETSSDDVPDAAPDVDDDSDKLSCQGLYSCVGECEGDEKCAKDCEAQASSEAIQQYKAVIKCLQENECQDLACAQEKCKEEGEACQ